MTSCCIGYYTNLSPHPQVIQGSYRENLNDPVYVQDHWESLVPFTADTVFAKNKEYDAPSDKLAGSGDVYRAKELSGKRRAPPMSGGRFKLWSRIEEEIDNIKEDPTVRDVRKGAKDVIKSIKDSKYIKGKGKVSRQSLDDKFKISSTKITYPAEGLKKRLMKKKGMGCHKRKPKSRTALEERRDRVKKLIRRIQ